MRAAGYQCGGRTVRQQAVPLRVATGCGYPVRIIPCGHCQGRCLSQAPIIRGQSSFFAWFCVILIVIWYGSKVPCPAWFRSRFLCGVCRNFRASGRGKCRIFLFACGCASRQGKDEGGCQQCYFLHKISLPVRIVFLLSGHIDDFFRKKFPYAFTAAGSFPVAQESWMLFVP